MSLDAITTPTSTRLTPLLLGLLEHLLHDLLLLDQESASHTVLNAVRASRAAVRTLDGLLRPADGGVLARAEGGNLCESGLSAPHSTVCVDCILLLASAPIMFPSALSESAIEP